MAETKKDTKQDTKQEQEKGTPKSGLGPVGSSQTDDEDNLAPEGGWAFSLERVSENDPAPVVGADEDSSPGPYSGVDGATPDDTPLRSSIPGTPLAISMAQGAGEHVPTEV